MFHQNSQETGSGETCCESFASQDDLISLLQNTLSPRVGIPLESSDLLLESSREFSESQLQRALWQYLGRAFFAFALAWLSFVRCTRTLWLPSVKVLPRPPKSFIEVLSDDQGTSMYPTSKQHHGPKRLIVPNSRTNLRVAHLDDCHISRHSIKRQLRNFASGVQSYGSTLDECLTFCQVVMEGSIDAVILDEDLDYDDGSMKGSLIACELRSQGFSGVIIRHSSHVKLINRQPSELFDAEIPKEIRCAEPWVIVQTIQEAMETANASRLLLQGTSSRFQCNS